MRPSGIGITVATTIAGAACAIWLIGNLPGIPYNLQELVTDRNPVIQAILLAGTLYTLYGIPALIARNATVSIRMVLLLPLVLVAQTAIVWLFLRSAAPPESIHDILGAPVLVWPWEWEYLFRLSGIVLITGCMLSGAALLAEHWRQSGSGGTNHKLLIWAGWCVPLLALSHWIIVGQAATDNLTELMAGGGRWHAALFLAVWLFITGLAGSLLSARLATGLPKTRVVIVLVITSLPVAYGCLRLGLEQEVHKYQQVFSALQFLLSANRANLASGSDLLIRFLIFHYSLVMLVAVFQYPVWAYRAGLQTADRSRRGAEARRVSYRIPPGLIASFAYGSLVIYGTLYPFDAWLAHASGSFVSVLTAWPAHISLADVLSNVMVYLPFGFLLAAALRKQFNPAACLGLASATGLLLSWTLEYLQYLVPLRNTSCLDLGLNLLGTAAGAAMVLVTSPEHAFGNRLLAIRNAWFQPGRGPNIALVATGLWLLASTFPFVPSIDLGSLRQGVAPLWQALQNPATFSLQLAAAHTLSNFGIGQLLMLAALSASRVREASVVLLTLVVILAVPIMERTLEAEILLALPAGVLLLYMFGTKEARRGSLLGSGAIITAYLAQSLHLPAGATGTQTAAFNWVPFALQMGNITSGLADILDNSWPFVALAYLAWNRLGGRFYRTPAVGAFLVFIGVFAINLMQQFIPGRYPDITDALVATSAWLVAWHMLRHRTAKAATRQPSVVTTHRRHDSRDARLDTILLAPAILLTLPLVSLLLGVMVPPGQVTGPPGRELPSPADLPLAPLTQFRHEHPRLPAPSPEDIATLRSRNPAYLRHLSRRAAGNNGKVDAIVTLAFIEPGSQDLGSLFERLLAIEFTKRASGEVKEVVLAYDWLYPQWDTAQRKQLRAKVADACDHLISYIREERLSPYNVILYNTLLQDLVACAIVLYDDDDRSARTMAFTYDLLKNRVLPVWRQIMGQNGGWHEGGEYVAVGIGKAVYQIPAMWRKATGEDLFSSEPGIRGFLDFLVYRTRPDGTQFRWGDGAHFDRRVPDRLPLAIEYRDAAAYSLNGCPRQVVPTSWPWGPLTDDGLCDPEAVSRLPLVRYFDGIGLLVARSDWTPDASYISFKAGDNYWSHSHLDQGSFTIYRGGALAIDSGAYGGGNSYGSDHHMNYAYQTIAHNTMTVLDPDDTLPAPRKDGTYRQIANDGGQRRIGSGWGIESAPLDLEEWQQKYEIYHTGSMEKVFLGDDLAVAVADLTPAYTNEQSGKGTFSHRTRRVEHYSRSFGFDLKSGTVVIFDRVRASNPEFRKRWLHHTLEKPRLTNFGYSIATAGDNQTGERGAYRLDAHVLLPRDHDIMLVGGPGREFYVDGRNYDEGGKTIEKIEISRKPVEAGRWRIELSPATSQLEDIFLVVLLPEKNLASEAQSQVRLVEEDSRIGCEVTTGQRTITWWFEKTSQGPVVEVSPGDGRREVHDLRVAQHQNGIDLH